MNKRLVIICVAVCLVLVCVYSAMTKDDTQNSVAELSKSTNVTNEDAGESEQSKETEESYKSASVEPDYKDLLRNEDKYIGDKLVITASVKQIFNESTVEYRVQTSNEDDMLGLWLDDEYMILDYRESDKIR